VVAEYDAAPTGEKGAVLRREGLYSSHVIEWRRARDAGALAGPARAGVAQASWYRRRASPPPSQRPTVPRRDRVQPRALSPAERAAILGALHAERFADTAPAEVWATLLVEGTYLGSLSTFYRLLRHAGETRERRSQAVHPAAVKPELMATGPNQVWS
jgi:putative transposase